MKEHEKKLMRLTENSSLPFEAKEVIRNFSQHVLSEQEEDILRNGLKYLIPPAMKNKTFSPPLNLYTNRKLMLVDWKQKCHSSRTRTLATTNRPNQPSRSVEF